MPTVAHNPVTAPSHYTVYPVQPITITRHLGHCMGNVVKYVVRAPFKSGLEDLQKALFYLDLERETPGCHAPLDVYEKELSTLITHMVNNITDDYALHTAQFLASFERYIDAETPAEAENYLQLMADSIRALVAQMEKPS